MKKRVFEFRPASLNEREDFYKNEFDIEEVKRWFKSKGILFPQLCAVDAGTETGIIIDKKLKGQMLYFPFTELRKKIKKYVPEDVYYDRNTYNNLKTILKSLNFEKWERQELAFDIDADNVKCKCKKNKIICDFCLRKTFIWARKMKKELEKEYKKVELVYSGRGFHVHVFDKKAFLLDVKEREKLNRKFANYPIDPWVSRGYIRLIRMPYSLNGLVSRRVIPIGKNLRFAKEKSYPKFLD